MCTTGLHQGSYVGSNVEVKWNVTEVHVPTAEHLVREDAIEM